MQHIINTNNNKLIVFLLVNNDNTLVKKLKLKLYSLAQKNLEVFFGFIDYNNFTKTQTKLKTPCFMFYFNKTKLETIINYTLFKSKFNEYNTKINLLRKKWLESQEVDNTKEEVKGTSLTKLQQNKTEVNSNISISQEDIKKLKKILEFEEAKKNEVIIDEEREEKLRQLHILKNLKYKIHLEKIQELEELKHKKAIEENK